MRYISILTTSTPVGNFNPLLSFLALLVKPIKMNFSILNFIYYGDENMPVF
jgi:hypothetical protein